MIPFSDDHKVLKEDWGMLGQWGGIDLCLILLIVHASDEGCWSGDFSLIVVTMQSELVILRS